MKKLFFIISVLAYIPAIAQPDWNLSPQRHVKAYVMMRPPRDTLRVAEKGSIASKGDNFYWKKPSTGYWVLLSGDGGGGNGIYGGSGTLPSDVNVNADGNSFYINNGQTISFQQHVFELRNKTTNNSFLEIVDQGSLRLWGDFHGDGTVYQPIFSITEDGSINCSTLNVDQTWYTPRFSIGSQEPIVAVNFSDSAQITLAGDKGIAGYALTSQGSDLPDIWAAPNPKAWLNALPEYSTVSAATTALGSGEWFVLVTTIGGEAVRITAKTP